MRLLTKVLAAGAALALTAPLAVPAMAQIITSNVTFPRGSTGTTINSTIVGEQTRDYVVRASAGQTLTVRKTGAPIVYFNVLQPGSNDEAIFVGSSSGNSYTGRLAASGAYKIRVYQMRATARRGERGAFKLAVSVTGRGKASGVGVNSTAGIQGMDAIKAVDAMTARGFVNVDTLSSGGEIYATYWKASTRECVQVNSRSDRVFGVEKVPSHPKCR
jgi:hypothetical protein